MKDFKNLLREYARLIIEVGINQQKDKPLVIQSAVEHADFVRLLAEEAYGKGCEEVIVNWNDGELSKLRYNHSPMHVFENIPPSTVEKFKEYDKRDAGFISITSEDPDLLKSVDAKKVSAQSKATSLALKEHYDAMMSDEYCWCVVAAAGKDWAKKIFPELGEEEAVSKLWDEIFKSTRMYEEDPVKAWREHIAFLEEKVNWLNEKHFRYLKYTNAKGTDLSIELPEAHQWMGGAGNSRKGIYFVANMPTEEVFTLPKKDSVNGTVYSSKPLVFNGNLIEDFKITFKEGRVESYSAKKGEHILGEIFAIDDNGRYLGEVALVPFHSPISQRNLIFFNTLFDENASCHLAFGQAYPSCLKGSENMSPEEIKAAGANEALVHEDFMVGTEDLSITGITWDGEKIPVFVKGDWA